VKKSGDRLSGYLRKNSRDNLVTVTEQPLPGSKNIITVYKKLKTKNGLSLLEIDLVTGRTHQIRAHMAYIGHPLLGDGKYGINRTDRASGYKYQALYSYRLRFKDIDGPLSYLSGKEIKVSTDNIWFLKEFEEGNA
ncbi:MAG: RNA pseudouridine synthase, partial [Clostridia bacterium]|nr:RNA pseudouridine synthase [Clostridia bacterium]